MQKEVWAKWVLLSKIVSIQIESKSQQGTTVVTYNLNCYQRSLAYKLKANHNVKREVPGTDGTVIKDR